MTTHPPTPEQQAILDHVEFTNESLVVDAKAGTGKTDTLIRIKKKLKAGTSFLYLAFNKSIADELKSRVELTFEESLISGISTSHAHGLSAFRKAKMKTRTFGGKLSMILKEVILRNRPYDDPIVRNKRIIKQLASLAKNYGFGLKSTHEVFPTIEEDEGWLKLWDLFDFDSKLIGTGVSPGTLISLARQLLQTSNRDVSTIDFDDMIYLPLLLGLEIPSYDVVFVDEAQDLNHTRRELIFRSINPGGRIIAVGDPNQAIYGFTGAATDSLDLITARAKCKTLTLSICWRCDAAIIREAQKQVPAIQARPNADEGEVHRLEMSDDFFDLPQPGDAILCRLNRPNVFVALRLMALGKRVKIEGRDIGRRLLDICEQADSAAKHLDLPTLRGSILDWYTREEARLVAAEKASQAVLLGDEVEAVLLLVDKAIHDATELGETAYLSHLEAVVSNLFDDDVHKGVHITLSSIHKAKGREFGRVFILGIPDYMPFHLAEADWEIVQEYNLIYVAKTRAEKVLVMVAGVKKYLDENAKKFEKKESLDD